MGLAVPAVANRGADPGGAVAEPAAVNDESTGIRATDAAGMNVGSVCEKAGVTRRRLARRLRARCRDVSREQRANGSRCDDYLLHFASSQCRPNLTPGYGDSYVSERSAQGCACRKVPALQAARAVRGLSRRYLDVPGLENHGRHPHLSTERLAGRSAHPRLVAMEFIGDTSLARAPDLRFGYGAEPAAAESARPVAHGAKARGRSGRRRAHPGAPHTTGRAGPHPAVRSASRKRR